MLAEVKKRKVDVVLVWRYDRIARSTRELVNQLEEFHAMGVDFVSLFEGVDTTTPQGKLVFTIMAGLAEFESALIGERVKAGRTTRSISNELKVRLATIAKYS